MSPITYTYYGYPTPPDDYSRGYVKHPMGVTNHMGSYAPPGLRPPEDQHPYAHHPYAHHQRYMHSDTVSQKVSPTEFVYPNARVMSYSTAGYCPPMVHPHLPPYAHAQQQGNVVLPSIASSVNHLAPINTKQSYPPRQPAKKEEKSVGGVSATLNYDMDTMVDFVIQSVCAIVIPRRQAPHFFRKWLQGVLTATRLPLCTILQSFEYLAINTRIIKETERKYEFDDQELVLMVTTSLILGSKFLDDNTFINKSWMEVSDIELKKLNKSEERWLANMQYRLHLNPWAPGGYYSIEKEWKQFDNQRQLRNLSQSSSPCSPYSPNYARFGPIGPAHSTSPQSAPHIGPTTPNHHSSQSQWWLANDMAYLCSRRQASQYSQHSSTTSAPYPNPPSSTSSASLSRGAPAPSSIASYSILSNNQMPLPMSSIPAPPPLQPPVCAPSHGIDCNCIQCSRTFMMQPNFGGPQIVAA